MCISSWTMTSSKFSCLGLALFSRRMAFRSVQSILKSPVLRQPGSSTNCRERSPAGGEAQLAAPVPEPLLEVLTAGGGHASISMTLSTRRWCGRPQTSDGQEHVQNPLGQGCRR